MSVRLPEADEFERLRQKHADEWPEDVKKAAEWIQLWLNTGNSSGFKQSKATQEKFAAEWADFEAKLEAWRSSRA